MQKWYEEEKEKLLPQGQSVHESASELMKLLKRKKKLYFSS